jgi:PAS domain S-box-containing protein
MASNIRARLIFLSAIAFLLLCGVGTFLSFIYFQRSEGGVTHTQEVRAAVGDFEAALNDTARVRTTYLITGDQLMLDAYNNGVRQLPTRLQHLRELTKDNPNQAKNCDRLASATKVRVEAWDTSILAKQRGEKLDLSVLTRTNLDLAANSASAAAAIREQEDQLLQHRRLSATRLFLVAAISVVTSFAIALILLTVYHFSLTRELRARELAEKIAKDAYARESALLQEEKRFHQFIDAVRDYAIFALDASGQISTWNKGAKRLKGYEASEILGQHFSRFYPPEDVQTDKPGRALRIAEESGHFQDQGWRVRKDGSRFWANVIITAIRDDRGRLLGFTKITQDHTEKKQAEESLRKMNADLSAEVAQRKDAELNLARSEKSLRDLSLCLLRSQDEERKRIGRELHDSLGQNLAVLKMNLDSVVSVTGTNHNDVGRLVAQCVRLTEESLKEVRTIAYLLYPPLLEEMGLKSAIPWYLDGFAKRSNIQTSFHMDADFGRMSPEIELTLFRVLQESLTNVHRHAKSPVAEVGLRMEGKTAVLEVRDHGVGLPEHLRENWEEQMSSLGVGLRGMSERVKQLGGKLDVASIGRGTVVTARVPTTDQRSAVSIAGSS